VKDAGVQIESQMRFQAARKNLNKELGTGPDENLIKAFYSDFRFQQYRNIFCLSGRPTRKVEK
jgi:hypothetical protein